MKAILMDSYRAGDKIVLWLKGSEDYRLEVAYSAEFFLEKSSLSDSIVEANNLKLKIVKRRDYLGNYKEVYSYRLSRLSRFEKIVKWVELQARHCLSLYNADISPEQMFLYENGLSPFDLVEVQSGKIRRLSQEFNPRLVTLELSIFAFEKIQGITFNGKEFRGLEKDVLGVFASEFERLDPDVIIMDYAFSKMPLLYDRLAHYKIPCRLNRWDEKPIRKLGGKSFFTYGKVIYRDYAVRLNGRFLVDGASVFGTECDVEGIMEISKLCSARFQQVASRSFGAAFQAALVRELVARNILVPFKEKPVDPPLTWKDLLKLDRVGHRMDSVTGLHEEVAEIDFSSLFPWIIYNYNISPENFKEEEPFEQIPGLPVKISLKKKGLVPCAIKPILDRRMHYKKNPTLVNKSRLQGLKWVLVTSYGYLRFREFKLGLAASHMIIGAYARKILIRAKEICEEKGFRVVHGIVDSLYIQKKGIAEEEVRQVCIELEAETGIPVSFEGIFKWVVFLPSINDSKRPLPAKYYGLFENGELKMRGIEARQAGSPAIVRAYQLAVLDEMKRKGVHEAFTPSLALLRKALKGLSRVSPHDLACSLTLSKVHYNQDNAQSKVIRQLAAKGLSLKPGQRIMFVHSGKGPVLPEDYDGKADVEKYKALLARSLYTIYQPLGYSREEINSAVEDEKQVKLSYYTQKITENKIVIEEKVLDS
jgi:DNA polymerase elongation subunit (family B)